jgi:hypothetical protein
MKKILSVLLMVPVMGLFLVGAAFASTADSPSVNRMSPAELKSGGKEMTDGMRKKVETVEMMLRAARKAKDIERLDDINDKLMAMKGMLNIAEGYYFDLVENLKAGDVETARGQYRKIQIAFDKLQELNLQVAAGSEPGTGGTYGQPSVVEWQQGDEDLPPDQTDEDVGFDTVFLDAPPVPSGAK